MTIREFLELGGIDDEVELYNISNDEYVFTTASDTEGIVDDVLDSEIEFWGYTDTEKGKVLCLNYDFDMERDTI